jgi:antitoxin component of MazEF toxin-antitoxin module
MRLIRQVIAIGNSTGITLPKEFVDAYGLERGALLEVRAVSMGLLLRPVRVGPLPGAVRWTVRRRGYPLSEPASSPRRK